MKTGVLLLGCLLALTSQAQTRRDVWQWRDENGVTHFSDYPHPGARKITLNGSPSPSTAPQAAVTTRSPTTAAAQQEVVYSRLEIWSPENGASFFEPDTVISLRVRAEPEVGPTHRLLTYLDGKLLTGENALEHSLTNVERGVHSATSVIVNRDGQELIRSEPVVFHMKQPSAANPRNQGPAQRPAPPRPTPLPATPRRP